MFASTDKYFHGVTNMKGTVTRIARVEPRIVTREGEMVVLLPGQPGYDD